MSKAEQSWSKYFQLKCKYGEHLFYAKCFQLNMKDENLGEKPRKGFQQTVHKIKNSNGLYTCINIINLTVKETN